MVLVKRANKWTAFTSPFKSIIFDYEQNCIFKAFSFKNCYESQTHEKMIDYYNEALSTKDGEKILYPILEYGVNALHVYS